MNWLASIRKLLGRFWYMVFGDHGLVSGVEKSVSLACQAQQAAHDKWAGGFVEDDKGTWFDSMPFVVYIPVADLDRPAASYADILNGDAALGDSQAGGWTARSLYETPHPAYLADHVSGYTVTLIDGFDYAFGNGGQYLFHVDLSGLGLPVVPLSDAEGGVKAYYKLFGWTAGSGTAHDAVRAFHGDVLDPWAPVVWDMHQNGATKYNVKQLLAGVTGSVICEQDGAIDHMWTEQGSACMLVGDKVYSAPPGTPVGLNPDGTQLGHGDSVTAGQVLFGSLRMYTGSSDIPAAAIPGLHVRTDAGELVARNTSVTRTIDDLPLEGDQDTLAEYAGICAANRADGNCPFVELPQQLNPMQFILGKLRRGRAFAVSLVARDLQALRAALACIRRCTNATGMVNVYVQAESDTVSVSARFTADSGQVAVSTVATVTVFDMFAEADTLI